MYGYNQYGQYFPNYSQNNYGAYQQMQPQAIENPMQAPKVQMQEIPFADVRYGTLDEAKAHIVAPMKSVMFINRTLGEFYVKSANQMGEPLLETFKYSKLDSNNVIEQKPVAIDTSQFVKSQDLENYITKEDIKGLVVEIDKLKKQLEISKIEKGEFKNGK